MLTQDELAFLLCEVSAGNKSAFTRLYHATSGIAFARVLRVLQDQDVAKDVLQNTFVSIWQNASKYDRAKGSVLAWISTIARNRALDALRARNRAPVTELIDEAIADDNQRTESLAETSLLSQLLEEHLSTLPKDVVAAIRLNIVEGLTCAEIGKILKISRNTVKSRVRRGLQRLRQDLPIASVQEVL